MRRIILKIYLIVCMFLNCILLKAQDYSFTSYKTIDGLPNNSILNIEQDKTGFIWLGTGSSISRFDGSHFKNYNPPGGAPFDYIATQALSPAGNIYLGTASGIFYYDTKLDKLRPFLPEIKGIYALYFDNASNLWIGTQDRLYRFSFRTQRLSQFNTFGPDKISAISGSKGKIWAGTGTGYLYVICQSDLKIRRYNLKHSAAASPTAIKAILPVRDSILLIGTSTQGLKSFTMPTSSYKDLTPLDAYGGALYVSGIIQKKEHEFWMSTFSGIVIYNDSLNSLTRISKQYENPYNLSDNICYSIFMDNEGGIWVGTYYGGVNYYNQYGGAKFKIYQPDNAPGSITGRAIHYINGDHNGHIWINTDDAGLNKLDVKTGSITPVFKKDDKPVGSFKTVQGTAVYNNRLWAGTAGQGIDILNIGTGAIEKHYDTHTPGAGLGSNNITCLCRTDNNQLFIGTDRGVYRYEPASDSFTPLFLEDRSIKDIIADKNRLWVSTYHELYEYDSADMHLQRSARPRKYNIFETTSIYLDSKSTLWICAGRRGIYYIEHNSHELKKLQLTRDFSVNFIMSIAEDNQHNYWIGTIEGLFSLDPETNSFTQYTVKDGLPINEFNFNASYKDASGNLYFGTTNGLVKFNPLNFRKRDFRPPLVITNLQISNKDAATGSPDAVLKKNISITDTVKLNYKQTSFNIEFAALGFANPASTKYFYKLEGLQEDWNQIKTNRKVYFTNISPGKYIFRVKSFAKGYLPSHERKLAIIITPPFWKTPIAYVFYIIFAITILMLALYYYKIRIQLKKDRELHDAKMTFYTNIAHEIKSPLSLIRGPLESITESIDRYPEIKEEVDLMEKSSSRLIALVNQLLDFRKIEAHGVQISAVEINLSQLISEICERHTSIKTFADRKLTLSLPEKDLYVKTDKEALEKILLNLINNAFKFSKAKISVELTTTDNAKKCRLTVKNDGFLIPAHAKELIFQPFYRVSDTAAIPGTGIGLALTKNLVDLIRGELQVQDTENGMNVFALTIPV